jgi:hypothetical protein
MLRLIQRTVVFAAIFTAVVFLGLAAFAQQNPKRLVLKDGSFQPVTKWEIQGKRVRYYSAERYSWEELPAELVDWPATETYNKERDSIRADEVKEIAKIAEKEEEVETPTVAPGLRLPDGGGVFILDIYQDQTQLIELTQDSGELNRQTSKNILRAAINPLAMSSKQNIELQGERARLQAHIADIAIFINIAEANPGTTLQMPEGAPPQIRSRDRGRDNATVKDPNAGPPETAPPKPKGKEEKDVSVADEMASRYRIVRVERKKGGRVIGQLNVSLYGKLTQKQNWVKADSMPLGGNWLRVTPAEPLAPGEYALVEVLNPAKNEINTYVWDFGVDPKAPANPGAWTPRKVETGPDGQPKPPQLEKRPRL